MPTGTWHISPVKEKTGNRMDRKEKDQPRKHGGVTDKHDKNSGSGGFNQGVQQDLDYEGGVADGTPAPDKVSREEQNPGTRIPDDEKR
jgi:hypothetical protein